MPRISRLTRSEVDSELVPVYDRFLRERGNVPYFFRTVAHRPEIMLTMAEHMKAVLSTGTLPTKLKELVVVRTSQLNCTAYCLASHSALALKFGWTSEHLEALKQWKDSSLFSDEEKAAIYLAEVMTLQSHDYSDADMAHLRSFYGEGEVIELMAAIGLFNYFNRFNNMLQMEPTKPATAEELVEAGVEAVPA
jgi:uncharacterized peroxidase-related enzyme